MFKSIEIQNFRSLKYLKIEDLKQFNLILGDTNVGKTTILESFFIGTAPNNLTLLLSMNEIRSINFDRDYFKTFFQFNNINKEIKIKATVKTIGEKERELKISPFMRKVYKVDDSDVKNGSSALPDMEKIDGLRNIFKISYKNQRTETYDYLFKLDEIAQPLVGEREKFYRPLRIEIKDDKKYALPFNARYEHTKSLVDSLSQKYDLIVKDLKKKDFIRIISKLDPNIRDIDKTENGIVIEYKGFKKSNPIGILGNGVIKMICVIAAIIVTNHGVVLIDEIENGIHHSLLNSFWKSIIEIAKKESVQIIATTHSIDCVNAFYENIYNEVEKTQLRVFRIEKTEENEFETIKYNLKDLKIALEENWEVR